jgi:hypothetical protein
MSLRRDIHSAFETITPPLGGMPERVVQTVLAQNKGRRRKETIVFGLRVPLAIAATFLLVALVAAALVTWNAVHNNTVPGGHVLTGLQQLEARPLNLPTLKPTDVCPSNPGVNSLHYDYGSGPVYADGGSETSTQWGNYWDVLYFTAPTLTGPVLIRGRDLMSADRKLVFVGAHSAGPAIGNDPVPGTGVQHTELVVDASHPETRTGGGVYGTWHVRQGMSRGWTGCFGFQFDGPTFSETITGFAAP